MACNHMYEHLRSMDFHEPPNAIGIFHGKWFDGLTDLAIGPQADAH